MAIEKTVFTQTAGANRLAEVRAWFAANATGFFDEITEISSNKFNCKKDNKIVLRFGTGITDSEIRLSNGTTLRLLQIASDFSPQYAVKTSKGFMIHWTDGGSNYAIPNSLFVTESSDGGIVVTFMGTVNETSNYNVFFSCDFDKSTAFAYYIKTSIDSSGISSYKEKIYIAASMTVFQPVPCNNVNSYGVGVYQMYYSQYPGIEGSLSADGKNYYSSGYLALEE